MCTAPHPPAGRVNLLSVWQCCENWLYEERHGMNKSKPTLRLATFAANMVATFSLWSSLSNPQRSSNIHNEGRVRVGRRLNFPSFMLVMSGRPPGPSCLRAISSPFPSVKKEDPVQPQQPTANTYSARAQDGPQEMERN